MFGRRRASEGLRDAELGDRDRLEGLLREYLFEFDGRTEPYPYLDAYWQEPERLPFLIEVDGDVVGPCLIRRREGGWSIAEFSVLPDRRRGGVGSVAVDPLAARSRSEGAEYLEAKVHPNNREALPIWVAVGFDVVEGPGTGVTVIGTVPDLVTCHGARFSAASASAFGCACERRL